MATEWFYRQGTGQIGPVSADQIRSMARDGKITPETLIRRSEDTKWIQAARFKGLFAAVAQSEPQQVEQDGEGPDLFDMTAKAANKAASAAGSAVSAVSGKVGDAVSGWLIQRKEKKAELAKVPPPLPSPNAETSWLDTLTRDNQPREVVVKVSEKVQGILMSQEELLYVAVQNKPVVNWMPDGIALTNKRFIFYHPKVLGRVDFEDYVWRELHDAHISEDLIGTTFTIKTASGRTLKMGYLPKSQARGVYRIAQEKEEHSLEERRQRRMEEARAASGAPVIQTNLAIQTPQQSQPIPVENIDPVQKLQQLKSMAEAGLISMTEYEAKKADILARM